MNSSSLNASADGTNAPPRGVSTGSLGHRPTRADDVDVKLTQTFSANLLLVGSEPAVSSALELVVPNADRAFVVHRRAERTRLPAAALRLPTVLVHDIETLTDEGQRALLDWLRTTKGHTRVVSTASRSLLPQLQAREFSAELYYLLNTVYIDLT